MTKVYTGISHFTFLVWTALASAPPRSENTGNAYASSLWVVTLSWYLKGESSREITREFYQENRRGGYVWGKFAGKKFTG